MATEGVKKGWKRLNFWKGLVATEADWMEEQEYRLEKHRFHNRYLHAPGVVRGIDGGLMVTSRGDLSVEIQPGFAIDGRGNELHLGDIVIKTLSGSGFKQPRETVYIVLRYVEQPTDFIAYKHNLSIRGHRRILETSEVVVTQVPPKLEEEVELARVVLDRSALMIYDAKDPENPQPNEIDLTHVPIAGVVGSRLDAKTKAALSHTLQIVRKTFQALGAVKHGTTSKYTTVREVVAAATTMLMMSTAGLVDTRNFHTLLGMLMQQMAETWGEIDMYDPDALQRPEFVEFKRQMTMAFSLLKERRTTAEGMQTLLRYVGNSCEHILRLFYR
jgi:hypothetical protein